MATKNIEPKLRLLGDYTRLEGVDRFRIPEYQRAYSWTKMECDKLWQDIIAFMDAGPDDPYFFGTIIIDCSSDNYFNLIDGQQRTTTFLLLLKAIQLHLKNSLASMDKSDDTRGLEKAMQKQYDTTFEILYKADEEKQLEIENNWDKARGIIVLDNTSINEIYKGDFQVIIESRNFEEAEKNVCKIPRKQKDNKYTNFFRNFKFFYEKLGEFHSESRLSAFVKTFLTKCQVIEIKSWQVEQAIAMFNSLNSTGMPLSDADIISAQLFSKTDISNREDFINRWKRIKESADTLSQNNVVDIDSVLQQFMYMERSRTKEYKPNEVTTPGIRKYYANIHPELLNDPKRLCNDYEKILSIWETIQNYSIIKLLLKINENFKPFLITYLFRFDEAQLTEGKVRVVGECLLRLFSILVIDDRGFSSALFKSFLFNENLLMVDVDYSESKILSDFNRHIRTNWKRSDLEEGLLDYEGNRLVYLNEYLFAKENNENFDFNENVNIEHIMPASGHNLETIRTDAGIEDLRMFEELVNHLGNKILLEENINKSISNDWFKTKKGNTVSSLHGYKGSAFGLAKKMANYPKDSWSKDDIDAATKEAAQRIADFIFNDTERSN